MDEKSFKQQVFGALSHVRSKCNSLEYMHLWNTVLNLPHNPLIAEIGAYQGASTTILGCAAKLKEGRVFTFDAWQYVPDNENAYGRDAEDSDASFDVWQKQMKRCSLTDTVTPICGDSFVNGKFLLATRSYDLVYIDGGHELDQPQKDVAIFSKGVKIGGLLILHDADRKEVEEATFNFILSGTNGKWEPVALYTPEIRMDTYRLVGA